MCNMLNNVHIKVYSMKNPDEVYESYCETMNTNINRLHWGQNCCIQNLSFFHNVYDEIRDDFEFQHMTKTCMRSQDDCFSTALVYLHITQTSYFPSLS